MDNDAHALAKIERELSNQCGKGYCVVCVASAEVGIEALERCEANGEDVALVLKERLMGLVPSFTAEWHAMVARMRAE